MLFRFSEALTDEDRESVRSMLGEVFPGAREAASEAPTFQVVPWRKFWAYSAGEIPAVTDLAIFGMKKANFHAKHFVIPRHGFCNFHLYPKRVCVSGFGWKKREKLKMLILAMGGVAESMMTPQTSVLVAKDAVSRRSRWARDHEIPVVSEKWLSRLAELDVEVPWEGFELRRLDGVVFSASRCGRGEMERIREEAMRAGGECGKHLHFKDQFLVIPDRPELNRKIRLAVTLGMSMTTPEHLREYVNGDADEIPMIMKPYVHGNVFDGYKFRIDEHCERAKELKQAIQLNGGTLVEIAADFHVALWGLDNSHKARTPVWVERCIVEQALLSAEVCPLYVPCVNRPLNATNMLVSISGFRKSQKLDIISALGWYSIPYTPKLKRTCTMLIAENMDSVKAQTAIEWGISVYNLEWLIHFIRGDGKSLAQTCISEPPTPSQIKRAFLDDNDDDDDFLAEYADEIEQHLREPIKKKPPHPSPLRPTAPAPANPSPKKFLSDDDDFDDIAEIEASIMQAQALTNPIIPPSTPKRGILDATNTILSYHRKPSPQPSPRPALDQIETWDTFTQIPTDIDDRDSDVTVSYVSEDEKSATGDPKSDPLMAQL